MYGRTQWGNHTHSAVAKVPAQQRRYDGQPVMPATQSPSDRPRFGINSLINRMTGHGTETEQADPRQVRQQPTVQATQARPESRDDEEDQIEIPAFLRRQAN